MRMSLHAPAMLYSKYFKNVTVNLICLKSLFAYRAYFSIKVRKENPKIRNSDYDKKKREKKDVFQSSHNSLQNILSITQLKTL